MALPHPIIAVPAGNSRAARALIWLDALTEALLMVMVVFAPWAFGTTQPWSERWMNLGGYALGALLAAKLWGRGSAVFAGGDAWARRVTVALFVLTLAVLGYILLSALNAGSTYVAGEGRTEPHAHVHWLPYSLDRLASWNVFWNWLALACVFWAAHDWLLGDVAPGGHRSARRLRRLVFVLALNAALVAGEGILQRNDGTPKLLWFKTTRENPSAASQFGPYAYRANAAQFFNLIWPVALGLWWHWHQYRRRRTERHHWLLPCVMLLIAGPLVSLSRGGVAVTILQLGACAFLFLAGGRFNLAARLGVLLVLGATLGAASYLGWEELAQRLRDSAVDPLMGRRGTYELAARMTDDYPWFGVGPGAFGSVFQFYRNSADDYWPGQLHNDWLEYLITFGRAGVALFIAAALCLVGRWFTPGGLRAPWTFVAFLWIALGGCLLHARFDFPLQIYSIQFVFVLLCAVQFSLSRARSGSAEVTA